MSGFKQKLRYFLVRSARDVAAQALPNWAQIAVSLAQNFHDVFVALPPAEQAGLIEVAEGLSASEWRSMRAQVEGELGGRYAEALDQAREALRGARGARGSRGEAVRVGLERTMAVQVQRSARRLSPGVAVSVLMGESVSAPPPRDQWPHLPGFELTGWLGEGASGKVFVAKREGTGELGARVALKVGPLTDRGRFEREVSLMERLRSPHLISALSHGVIEGFVPLYWIEMPLMGGQTLAEVPRGELEESLRQCLGVWRGLKALHEAGVAHRDLKPANVLMSTQGEPKLCDFGLSKSVGGADASLTQTGMAFGSPAYMAPEAIKGERVGLSADVWSFGVMVCELVGGRLPFSGRVAGEVWASALRDEPTLSSLPEWLRGPVAQCLTKEASARPQDAKALESLLAGPMEAFLAERARERAAEAERKARLAKLRAQLLSDEEAQQRTKKSFLEHLYTLSIEQIDAQWEALDAERKRRLREAVKAQELIKREILALEGRPLPHSLVRLETLITPITRVVREPVQEEVHEQVQKGGFLGFGSTTKTVTRTVTKTRERHVTKHLTRSIEIYSFNNIEFKLIQLPEKGFAIGQTQVTQALWEAVMGANPSNFTAPQKPVETVSWEDCVKFVNALSRKLELTPAYSSQ